jgi:1-acyl-sn-glycerol-3-phosphate acyltransferase
VSEYRTAVKTAEPVVAPSQRLLSFFRLYLVWYLRRHFHALRLANATRFPSAEKLVVYINHPSWWDPITVMMVSHHLLPNASHYGPMDAKALQHYGLFRRMGAFPVATDSPAGASQFLSSAQRVLDEGGVLWITPEGRFTDTRTRPVLFKSGLARLVSQTGRITLVPLALEYTYWDERLPEILVNCGEPLRIANGRLEDTHTWKNLMSYAMASTQEELAQLATTREPAHFETVLAGGTGVSGMYEYWKRLQTALIGADYHAEHGSLHKR